MSKVTGIIIIKDTGEEIQFKTLNATKYIPGVEPEVVALGVDSVLFKYGEKAIYGYIPRESE